MSTGTVLLEELATRETAAEQEQRAVEAARELGIEYNEQVQQAGQDAWARVRSHQGGAAAMRPEPPGQAGDAAGHQGIRRRGAECIRSTTVEGRRCPDRPASLSAFRVGGPRVFGFSVPSQRRCDLRGACERCRHGGGDDA